MGNCGCKYIENNSDIIVPTSSQTHSTLSLTEKNPLVSHTPDQIVSTESSTAIKSEYKCSSSCSSGVAAFQKRKPILVKLQLKKQLNKDIL